MKSSAHKLASRKVTAASRVFRTKEVARILAISPSRVRRHVHAGLCTPSRKGLAFEFTFQDLVLLRAAQGLLKLGISPQKVHRTLATVARRADARPLSSLRFHAVGKKIVVQDGSTAWNSESGQLLFGFHVAELARAARVSATPPTLLARRPAAAQRDEQAADWFERGVALEHADDTTAAAAAYHKALEFDPEHGDATVNLGRLLHQQGSIGAAARLYRRALEIDPEDAVAHYNLALVLEDQHRPTAALSHYCKAVEIAPAFADAHYNLARLYEERGRHADAARHVLLYSKLTKG